MALQTETSTTQAEGQTLVCVHEAAVQWLRSHRHWTNAGTCLQVPTWQASQQFSAACVQ